MFPDYSQEPKRAVGDKGATQIYTAKVIHPYKATSPGELNLRMGDTIKDVTMLQGGWCKVNMQHYPIDPQKRDSFHNTLSTPQFCICI